MRVTFLTAILPQYRVPFHEKVRATLAARGIQYDLIYGQPDEAEAKKQHCVTIPWGMQIQNKYISIGRHSAVWQPALQEILRSDLVVVTQENKLLLNYIIQVLPRSWRPKFCLWGHGRNFQADAGRGPAARWKAIWATKCDWWFAYTEQTRKIVEGYGFPAERITVFNNSVDTAEIRDLAAGIGQSELAELYSELKIETDKVAVYVGGLYDHKRIQFLIEAMQIVQREIPDFKLIVVGDGINRGFVEKAAAEKPWIRYLGPLFGRRMVAVLKLGRAFAMPGLVGLSILDSAAVGIPIITTAYPYHSPEIEYLDSGRNGLMVDDWQNPKVYADTVISVLRSEELQAKLANGAKEMAKKYTIENMAERFCKGVMAALSAQKR